MQHSFLLINIGWDFLGIAQRIQQEGYKTFSYYVKSENNEMGKTGEGIIPIVDDHFDVLNQFKDKKKELIILIDDNSLGDLCDYLKDEGWMVIGSSHFGDSIEHEREMGNKLAKKIGLELPPTKEFTDFNTARKALQGINKDLKLVFKADGADLAGGSKTYLAKSVKDLLWFMDWVEKDQTVHNYKVEKFELQVVIDGIEADYSSWFNGKDFTDAISITMEDKKVNGLGAAEGCLGQVVIYIPRDKNQYYQKYFKNLIPILKERNDTATWAANNIIDKNGLPYFLEWTPRFGWDSTIGELALLQDAGKSIGEFFIYLATKTPFPKGYFPTNKYSVAVRLYSESAGKDGKDVKGKPISWDKRVENNLWFYNIRKREDNFEITGNPIGVATYVSDSLEKAIEGVYKTISPKENYLTTPDLWYSEHIGERAIKELPLLKKEDWL